MAPLKAAIQALDPAPDKKSELTLLLSLLSELCEQKVEAFSAAIDTDLRTAVSGESKTVPVTEVLAKHKEYRAYVQSDAGKIATEVASSIKKFITGGSGNIVDGIADLVTTGIEAIVGAGNATQQELSSYYIIVQSFAIMRFDIRVWSRQIEAKGITSQIETAMAVVAYKSSVDVTKLSLNTFLIAYQGQLALIGIEEAKWKEYLDAAEALYERLVGDRRSGSTDTTSATLTPSALQFRVPGQLYGTLWDADFGTDQPRVVARTK